MKKLTFSVLLTLLTAISFANELTELLIKQKEQSVFLLQCFNEKNQLTSSSSGFFIDQSGVALTNVHVFKDAFRAKIKTSDGKIYDVEKVIDYNPSLDIAKIQIKKNGTSNFPAVKIARRTAEKGEEIFALSTESGQETKIARGTVSSLNAKVDFGIYYQISAALAATGGIPVFNADGDVVAITAFGQATQSNVVRNINYAVNVGNLSLLNRDLNLKLEKSYKDIVYDDFVAGYIMSILNNDHENAIRACDKQIEEKPYSWLAYHYRGISKVELNKHSEAEVDIKKALQLNKGVQFKELDYLTLGKIYQKAKMYEQSKGAYMKALEINQTSAVCYCQLSKLAEEWMGQGNRLIEESYMKALSLDPTSCSFAYRSIALNSLSQQQFEKAISYFSKAIETETEKQGFLIEYYNRANCYYETKRFDLAISDFESCLKLMPSDYESSLSIGMCYFKMGKKAQACEAYQKAKQIVEAHNLGNEAKSTVNKAILVHCK